MTSRELQVNRSGRYFMFFEGGFTRNADLENRRGLIDDLVQPVGGKVCGAYVSPEAKGVGVIEIRYPGDPRDLVPALSTWGGNLSSSPVY